MLSLVSSAALIWPGSGRAGAGRARARSIIALYSAAFRGPTRMSHRVSLIPPISKPKSPPEGCLAHQYISNHTKPYYGTEGAVLDEGCADHYDISLTGHRT